jgi:hypothetical protein
LSVFTIVAELEPFYFDGAGASVQELISKKKGDVIVHGDCKIPDLEPEPHCDTPK